MIRKCVFIMLRLFFGQEPIAVKSAEDDKEPRYGPPDLYKRCIDSANL